MRIAVIPRVDNRRCDSYTPHVHWLNPKRREYTLCGKWCRQWEYVEEPATCSVCRRIAAAETRSGAAAARGFHKPEAGGSTPPSATK